MPKTFLNLQNEILTRADLNNHDRPLIQLEINAAIQDLYRERRWSWGQTLSSVALTAGSSTIATGSYNAAPDWSQGRIQSVVSPLNQGVPVPRFVDYTTEDPAYPWVRRESTETGWPTLYSVFGGAFRFNRKPTMNVQYNVLSWAPPADLVADGDLVPLPDLAIDAVVWKTLSRAVLIHDHDVQLSQVFRAEYAETVSKLRTLDHGSVESLRVAMPDHYGGAYDFGV